MSERTSLSGIRHNRFVQFSVLAAALGGLLVSGCKGDAEAAPNAQPTATTEPTPGSTNSQESPTATPKPTAEATTEPTPETIAGSIEDKAIIELTGIETIDEARAIIDAYWKQMETLFKGYDFEAAGAISLSEIKSAEYQALDGNFGPLISIHKLSRDEFTATKQATIDYITANKAVFDALTDGEKATFQSNGYNSLPSVEKPLVQASLFVMAYVEENGITAELPDSQPTECVSNNPSVVREFTYGGAIYAGTFLNRSIFVTQEAAECPDSKDAIQYYYEEAQTIAPELYDNVPTIRKLALSQEEFYKKYLGQFATS